MSAVGDAADEDEVGAGADDEDGEAKAEADEDGGDEVDAEVDAAGWAADTAPAGTDGPAIARDATAGTGGAPALEPRAAADRSGATDPWPGPVSFGASGTSGSRWMRGRGGTAVGAMLAAVPPAGVITRAALNPEMSALRMIVAPAGPLGRPAAMRSVIAIADNRADGATETTPEADSGAFAANTAGPWRPGELG